MAKTVLYVLGAILVVVGLVGFVQNPILGLFEVDTVHNLVHLLSGVLFLAIGAFAAEHAQLTAKMFGVVYGVLAVLGFLMTGEMLLSLMHANLADAVLHAAIALILLYVGFMAEKGVAAVNPGLGGSI